MSYLVRRLSQASHVPISNDRRDLFDNATYADGAVYEVAAEQVRLTPDEVEGRLESGWLRSSDLVMIAGTWVTLSESLPFAEIAEPFARREQRRRTVIGTLVLFALLVMSALVIFAPFLLPR